MKERPILFKGEMVRAILSGRKTQTRRLVKPQPVRSLPHTKEIAPNFDIVHPLGWRWGNVFHADKGGDFADGLARKCPYGVVGDRLWVKETWRPRDPRLDSRESANVLIEYSADGASSFFYESDIPNWWNAPKAAARGNVTPLFMPRWASRITLEVTGVRVERLCEISEEDARAEGVDANPYYLADGTRDEGMSISARRNFEALWNSINGVDGRRWSDNPWCWVIAFRRLSDEEAKKGRAA